MTLRDAAPALGVFVVALAYLLLLRPYGFQLEDEGTLLSWFDRATRGQRPYLDFHTGYTPGFFAFGTAVFSAFGASATVMRAVLAVINASAAAGLTEATRRLAGNQFAPVPAMVWLAFVPVYVGEFAAFNIPYPTWPVTLAWVVLALAMLAWMEKQRAPLLVLAGVAAAAAMWFRPNSGALALAAVTWIVVAVAARRSSRDRSAATAAAAFMAAGVWYMFEFRVAGSDAFVHLLPAFAIAVLCVGPLATQLDRDHDHSGDRDGEHELDRDRYRAGGATVSLAILAASFLLPTLAWTLPLLDRLGLDAFLYEVFLVGADYQRLYYIAHPEPEPYAALVVAAMAAVAVGGRLVSRRVVKPLPLLLAVAAVGGAVTLSLLRDGVAPEGLLRSIVAQLENASFWLAAVTGFGAVAWLWLVPADELRRSSRARAMVVLAPLSVAMYAQLFPRSDFMHQVTAVPLTAVVACGLLERVASWWARGDWPEGWNGRRVVHCAILAAAAAILLLVVSEKVAGPLEALSGPAPSTPMPPRLDVHVEAAAGDELEAIAQSVAFLQANTAAGEALWSFPATSGLLFAAGRTNLAPHDYWYPGRPDRAEETRVLAMLRQQRPRFVVTLGRGWNFFAESPAYFEQLRRHVAGEYRLAARFGRYDVLARNDVTPVQPAEVPAAAVNRGEGDARRAVLDGNLERRRQAAWRWMDSLTPAEAGSATLPADRREAVLLLRALRDGGDMRGAGWAIAGFESADARIRGEAVDAMLALARTLDSARHRFANDFDAGALRPYVRSWAERARPIASVETLRPFADAMEELAAEPGAKNFRATPGAMTGATTTATTAATTGAIAGSSTGSSTGSSWP